MTTKNIQLIELCASDDMYLTDLEKTNVFKKIVCKSGDEDKFIEISEADANKIIEYNEKLNTESVDKEVLA